MNCATSCAAVIPCLNEASTIRGLVQAVRGYLPNVIVVDDGSTDATGAEAGAAGAEVIRHPEPQGKGAALLDGWNRALSRGFAWVLSMDGDGQHAPEDIPAFLACADAGGATLIVGNRMIDPAGMPWLRRQVNQYMSRRLSRLTGQSLPDTQCGYRLMRLDIWAQADLQTRHFELESEVLLAYARANQRIQFVPIRVIYQNETSKINPLRDTWRWFRWLKGQKVVGSEQSSVSVSTEQ